MNLKLFYQDKDGKEHLIQSLDDNRIIFEDFKSYNAYIEFENIEYILKNFYLRNTNRTRNNNNSFKI